MYKVIRISVRLYTIYVNYRFIEKFIDGIKDPQRIIKELMIFLIKHV